MIFDIYNFIKLINEELNRNDIELKRVDNETYKIREKFPIIRDLYFTRGVGYISVREINTIKEENKKLRFELYKPLYKVKDGKMYYDMPRMRLEITVEDNSVKEKTYKKLFPQGDFPLSKYIAIGIKNVNLENKIDSEWLIKN